MNQIIPLSKPASNAEISSALQVLFDAMPFQRGASDNAALAYIDALSGCSAESVKAGIRKFLRGECEGVSTKFVPSPPELSRIVRSTAVPENVRQERRRQPPLDEGPAARARMRLKFPMFVHAFPSKEMIAELARANEAGLEEMVLLATKWGVPIPDELNGQTDADWHSARNKAWAEIERNPPPFLRQKPA